MSTRFSEIKKKFWKRLGKRKKIAGIIIVAALLLIFLAFYKLVEIQLKPVTETPMGEMRKLPRDIKKELDVSRAAKSSEANTSNPISNASSSATIRVPILMYHYVEYVADKTDKLRVLLNINPDIFERQVQTLKNANYTFMTAKELGLVIDGKMNLPQNPVLLTFDDGHWDFDTVVLPILKKYNVKATAYIIPGFLGGSDFMTKAQLQNVIDSGIVDIGAHTVHHISLKGKLYPVVNYEVTKSKSMLEDSFNIKVVSFAYPNGAFDKQAINVVKNAGFSTAVSTVPGIEQDNANRFFLYRLRPGRRIGQILLNYLQNVK